jgi:2-phosphosulfolactate phosphatase
MSSTLQVLFSPAEFAALPGWDLTRTTCVVFDVLRATSSMTTALFNGADAVYPVAEIPEALAFRKAHPQALLAGERNGVRIRADQTGEVDFDLGNSPREFTRERVAGRTIAMTTTNGTRALRSCRHAKAVLAGCFLNLGATVDWIGKNSTENLLLVCGGTLEEASFEDTLAAGAVCNLVWTGFERVSDSAQMARLLYQNLAGDLLGAMQRARNGRRLLGIPELRDDVAFCMRVNAMNIAAVLKEGGGLVSEEKRPRGTGQ